MILPTINQLEEIREGNSANNKDWQVISKYLSTGICDSYNDVLICYNNMLSNRNWYDNELYSILILCNLPHTQSDSNSNDVYNIFLSGMLLFSLCPLFSMIGIFSLNLSFFKETFVSVHPCISAVCTTLGIMTPIVIQFDPDRLAKVKLKRIENKLKSIVKKLQKNKYIKLSQDQVREISNTKEQTNIKKDDWYLQEIAVLLDEILKYKYPGFGQDVYDLAEMAKHYKNREYTWDKLTSQTRENLIQGITKMKWKIDPKVEKAKLQHNLDIQTQTMIIDKINDALGSSFLDDYDDYENNTISSYSDSSFQTENGPVLGRNLKKENDKF